MDSEHDTGIERRFNESIIDGLARSIPLMPHSHGFANKCARVASLIGLIVVDWRRRDGL